MKRQRFVAVMVALCVLAVQAGAQVVVPRKGNWDNVRNLPRGTLISVKWALADKSTQTVRCVFHSADETEVVCGHWSRPRLAPYPVFQPSQPDRYVFPRAQVVQVRIENEDLQTSESTVAGALAGAVVGGIAGYNCCRNGYSGRPGAAGVLSLVGALVGGAIGHSHPFVRGRLIYEQ
jgi:hypothetical protein